MLTGTIKSVTLVENIGEQLDYCRVQIDFDDLAVFGKYSEIFDMIGKFVEYQIGQDVWKGQPITRVINYYTREVVQTVDCVNNVKLIPESSEVRSICNFDSANFKIGDSDCNCIAILSGYEKGSSKISTWIDMTMIDMNARQFVVRIFTNRLVEGGESYEEIIKGLIGKYVKFDPVCTKYGINTQVVEYVNTPVVRPPEVAVAIEQIKQKIADDPELLEYISQYDYFNTLSEVIYGEPGYHLVEVAMELFLIDTLSNISYEYDYKLLRRAAVTSRGYLLPSKTKFSKSMLNTNKVLRSKLSGDRGLLLILDILSEEEKTMNACAYYRIKSFCKQVLKERRGISAKEVDININDIINIM